ncbi:unnamed protein product [Lupinus luteus]|uniref:NTF2-like domain-containing protein n=1 Tax=Lupinus luteus TaxID=3873 RepID=A0AAV1WPP7_LUPLU
MAMTLFTHSPEFSIPPKIVHNCKIHQNPNLRKVQSFEPFRNNKAIRSSKVVSCKLKDFGVLGLDQNLRLYGQFSVPVKEESREEKEKHNYYVNMGYAIRTLREDFPQLFCREPRFDIYRDDIVFKDPLNTFIGMENYKSIFWALRFQGRIFFKALWVDLTSVWQPAENVVMVRWTIHGVPRVPWESRGRFDGTSEYKLDKEGKIYEHQVDNIATNKPPRFNVLGVEELLQSISCPSTPRPTYFEISTSTERA